MSRGQTTILNLQAEKRSQKEPQGYVEICFMKKVGTADLWGSSVAGG